MFLFKLYITDAYIINSLIYITVCFYLNVMTSHLQEFQPNLHYSMFLFKLEKITENREWTAQNLHYSMFLFKLESAIALVHGSKFTLQYVSI